MKAFGPVPSRRLGRSLGINNIPPKVCTYACVYCQLGRTIKMTGQRDAFYPPEEIVGDVEQQVARAGEAGEAIDYLTFVPDGEPTLDINLEREIDLLRPLGIKIAVITNSSLIWQQEVRAALTKADLVSLKVDSVDDALWRKIDRPHGSLKLAAILSGVEDFARHYRGELVTETLLVKGLNDGDGHLEEVAAFLVRLKPDRAYLSVPTRPPAEKWVQPPSEIRIHEAYQLFRRRLDNVEYLIGYEGDAFSFTGDVAEDLLNITAVHPMREEAVARLLEKAGADWDVVQRLVEAGQIIKIAYDARTFYMRKLPGRRD